jgi:AcrR family transcriptional regulator
MELSKRQKEIIDISIGLIAESGIQNLTIKNISQAIGISEPAIYRHFKNKFEILDTLLETFQEVSIGVLDYEEHQDQDSLTKICHFICDRYRRCAENPKLAKVMFSEENFQDDERLSKKVLMIMHSHKDKMHKAITAGQENGEIRNDIDALSLFRIIFGPMRLLIKQWCLSGFAFDIQSEGRKLWLAEEKMISTEQCLCT